MTLNYIAKPDTNTESTVKRISNERNKNVLKCGSVHENIEINEKYLEKILHNNNLQLNIAMQIISKDKTVRSETLLDSKNFNSKSPTTRGKKGEELVSRMPAIKKAFDLMGDDIVDSSTENVALKSKLGSYDEKWIEKSNPNLLKQIDDEERAFLIMSRMKQQMNKQY